MKGIIKAIESFDVTDENGVRVTGTVEAYRDRNGPFYDPNSQFYHNPRFSQLDINYLNTRDVCRINPEALSKAVQEAFSNALVKLGIPDPKSDPIAADVDRSIAATRQQCARNPDKYVSNQTSSAMDLETGRPVGTLTARAYAAIPDGSGGAQTVLARENQWPAEQPSAGAAAAGDVQSLGSVSSASMLRRSNMPEPSNAVAPSRSQTATLPGIVSGKPMPFPAAQFPLEALLAPDRNRALNEWAAPAGCAAFCTSSAARAARLFGIDGRFDHGLHSAGQRTKRQTGAGINGCADRSLWQ